MRLTRFGVFVSGMCAGAVLAGLLVWGMRIADACANGMGNGFLCWLQG